MKFDSTSALAYLEGNFSNFKYANDLSYSQVQIVQQVLKDNLSKHGKEWKENLRYWCKSFLKAYIDGERSIYTSLVEGKVNMSGNYVGVDISNPGAGQIVTFYHFDVSDYNIDGRLGAWFKNTFVAGFDGGMLRYFIASMDDGRKIEYVNNMLLADGFTHTNILTGLLQSIAFLKYCPVEVKILAPKSKIDKISCRYQNKTNLKIQIYDSKWYTTLVQSGFLVRGHLRLQACGEGWKDRKMIFVEGYEKKGYTAPARKLNA